jgi:uncharacterized protein (TIGR02594 family)
MTPYEVAKTQIGIKETPGAEHTKRVIEYHATTTLKATTDEVSWCSSFVNWCVEQAGLQGTKSAAARSWLKWGTVVETPEEGDILIFKRGAPPSGHVGFYAGESESYYRVLGGNQSDQVKISQYKKSELIGVRRA